MKGSTVARRLARLHLFWKIAYSLAAVQLAGLITYSWYLYQHFDLLEDFAHNAQAWYLIGHGIGRRWTPCGSPPHRSCGITSTW